MLHCIIWSTDLYMNGFNCSLSHFIISPPDVPVNINIGRVLAIQLEHNTGVIGVKGIRYKCQKGSNLQRNDSKHFGKTSIKTLRGRIYFRIRIMG